MDEYALYQRYDDWAILRITRQTDHRYYFAVPPVKHGRFVPYLNRGNWLAKADVAAASSSIDELEGMQSKHTDFMRLRREAKARHDQELLELSRTFNPFHKER